MKHCGFSYTECRTLPVEYRKWFLGKLIKESADRKKEIENQVPSNVTPKLFGQS